MCQPREAILQHCYANLALCSMQRTVPLCTTSWYLRQSSAVMPLCLTTTPPSELPLLTTSEPLAVTSCAEGKASSERLKSLDCDRCEAKRHNVINAELFKNSMPPQVNKAATLQLTWYNSMPAYSTLQWVLSIYYTACPLIARCWRTP
jgi:hypothetical protein